MNTQVTAKKVPDVLPVSLWDFVHGSEGMSAQRLLAERNFSIVLTPGALGDKRATLVILDGGGFKRVEQPSGDINPVTETEMLVLLRGFGDILPEIEIIEHIRGEVNKLKSGA